MRGDRTERPLERPGEGRLYITATGETRRGETVQNGYWRKQVREDSTEWPPERPGIGRQYRMATGETE